MHFDFRPLLRRTFAKIPLFTDPSHQQGAHQRKCKRQGYWCLALAQPHFWKLILAAVFGAGFLLRKASLGCDSGKCKDLLQDHRVRLRAKPRPWKLGGYLSKGQGDCPKVPHRKLNQNQSKINPKLFGTLPCGRGRQPFARIDIDIYLYLYLYLYLSIHIFINSSIISYLFMYVYVQ